MPLYHCEIEVEKMQNDNFFKVCKLGYAFLSIS